MQNSPTSLCFVSLIAARLAFGTTVLARQTARAIELKSHTPQFHLMTDADGD